MFMFIFFLVPNHLSEFLASHLTNTSHHSRIEQITTTMPLYQEITTRCSGSLLQARGRISVAAQRINEIKTVLANLNTGQGGIGSLAHQNNLHDLVGEEQFQLAMVRAVGLANTIDSCKSDLQHAVVDVLRFGNTVYNDTTENCTQVLCSTTKCM